jgi:hypothetical protein
VPVAARVGDDHVYGIRSYVDCGKPHAQRVTARIPVVTSGVHASASRGPRVTINEDHITIRCLSDYCNRTCVSFARVG